MDNGKTQQLQEGDTIVPVKRHKVESKSLETFCVDLKAVKTRQEEEKTEEKKKELVQSCGRVR